MLPGNLIDTRYSNLKIPAACSHRLTIVVSPLISLIQDQVMIAQHLNLNVNFLGGGQTQEENSVIWRGRNGISPIILPKQILPLRSPACGSSSSHPRN